MKVDYVNIVQKFKANFLANIEPQYFYDYLSCVSLKDIDNSIKSIEKMDFQNLNKYCNGEIDYYSFSILIMINHTLKTLLKDKELNSFLIYRINAHLGHIASEKEENLNSPNKHTTLYLIELSKSILNDLVQFNKIKCIREIIDFQSTSYIEKLSNLLNDSNTYNDWLNNRILLIPYTQLRKYFPIYNENITQEGKIYIEQDKNGDIANASFNSGRKLTIKSYVQEFFLEDEIKIIEEHYKITEELFAQSFALIMCDFSENDLSQIIEKIKNSFHKDGYIAAKKELVLEYKVRLRVPKYLYEKTLEYLENNR